MNLNKEKDSIQEIIENVKKEHKTDILDVGKILETSSFQEIPHFLKNKTTEDLLCDVREALQEIPHLDTETIEKYTQKLKGYIPVDDIELLVAQRFVRWMYRFNEEDTRLKMGVVLKLLMKNDGINVQMRTMQRAFLQIYEIKLDECLVFMKLSEQENLMVIAEDLMKQ